MSEQLTVNFHFTYPNMTGGTKSCRLLAEEMQRQGADVVIYHPDDPRYYDRSLARKIFDSVIDFKNKITESPDGSMKHHLEKCEVPVVSCKGNKIKQHHVRRADFDIANFWQQRAWMYDWQGTDFTPGLYVRGHAAGGADNLARAYSSDGITVTHATWLRDMLKNEYNAKHVILAPNGVDRRQFKYTLRSKNSEPTLGFQYAVDPRKGADTLLAAYAEIIKERPDVKLISYGSCDQSTEHKSLFPSWKHYCRPDYDLLADLYHQTDCWVLPSTSEGLPMPPLEAAASGTPVVATNCGGPEDYVSEGKSGFIIPIGDHHAMAEAVKRIMFAPDDVWKAMSVRSYENTLAFDWTQSASHLIKELLKYRDAKH